MGKDDELYKVSQRMYSAAKKGSTREDMLQLNRTFNEQYQRLFGLGIDNNDPLKLAYTNLREFCLLAVGESYDKSKVLEELEKRVKNLDEKRQVS